MVFDFPAFKDFIESNGIKGALAVIGDPISHSMSPLLHRLLGEQGLYAAVRVEEKELAPFCEFARGRLDGFNVTVPHKIKIMEFLDSIDPFAEKPGSVNTVKVEGGKLVGFNTDAFGIAAAFKESGVSLSKKRALILGGGGAARAALFAMKEGGAEVSIAVRDEKKVKSAFPGESVLDLSQVQAGWDIVVNCTPCGMKGQEGTSAIEPSKLKGCRFVYDTVYNPLKTRLLKAAKSLGIKHSNGLDMLIYQAAEARRIWGKGGTFDPARIKDRLAGEILSQRLSQKGKKGIALCGFMCSGKSHIARALAGRFGFRLAETDAMIEEREGITISQIFERLGEGYFRDRESEVIKSLRLETPSAVSLGGGAVAREENAAAVKESCILIYIDTPLETCLKRAGGGGRPLLRQDPQKVAGLYEERRKIYEGACDYRIDGNKSADEIIDDIMDLI